MVFEVGIQFCLGGDEVAGEESGECCFWEEDQLSTEAGGGLEECDNARDDF